ncbi:MAG: hypothetical protein IKX40_09450 [Thermoguttaceae bacterium]|nr:hypothetical protein [Clostridia bacterium]MBR5710971.1 hypothetical protein [Thermoguttaceae bacterium]
MKKISFVLLLCAFSSSLFAEPIDRCAVVGRHAITSNEVNLEIPLDRGCISRRRNLTRRCGGAEKWEAVMKRAQRAELRSSPKANRNAGIMILLEFTNR